MQFLLGNFLFGQMNGAEFESINQCQKKIRLSLSKCSDLIRTHTHTHTTKRPIQKEFFSWVQRIIYQGKNDSLNLLSLFRFPALKIESFYPKTKIYQLLCMCVCHSPFNSLIIYALNVISIAISNTIYIQIKFSVTQTIRITLMKVIFKSLYFSNLYIGKMQEPSGI